VLCAENALHGGGARLDVGRRSVHHVHQQIRLGHLLEGRPEGGHQRVRQLLDEAAKVTTNSLDALKKLADIDMAFHQIIYEASGNRQLKEIIESLLYKMSMYWFQVGFSAAEFREQFEELEDLLRAIEGGRKKDAREIMKRHIDHFIKLIKENIF